MTLPETWGRMISTVPTSVGVLVLEAVGREAGRNATCWPVAKAERVTVLPPLL